MQRERYVKMAIDTLKALTNEEQKEVQQYLNEKFNQPTQQANLGGQTSTEPQPTEELKRERQERERRLESPV